MKSNSKCYFYWGVYKRTNSLAPRQPKKDLPRQPSAPDQQSNIGYRCLIKRAVSGFWTKYTLTALSQIYTLCQSDLKPSNILTTYIVLIFGLSAQHVCSVQISERSNVGCLSSNSYCQRIGVFIRSPSIVPLLINIEGGL